MMVCSAKFSVSLQGLEAAARLYLDHSGASSEKCAKTFRLVDGICARDEPPSKCLQNWYGGQTSLGGYLAVHRVSDFP